MKALLLSLLTTITITATTSLLVACGGPETTPSSPTITSTTLVPETDTGQLTLEKSLNRYRAVCKEAGHGALCDRPVEIVSKAYLPSATGLYGRCDAEWEGSRLKLQVFILEDALAWSPDLLDLLVAHEAEHCVRGVSHDESGEPKLMRPDFLTEEEATLQDYRTWVEESFVDRPTDGDPTAL